MNTATTNTISTRKRTRSRSRSSVLTHAQLLEFQSSRSGPHQKPVRRRDPLEGMAIPRTSTPRPGGRLAGFLAAQVAAVIFEDGYAYVSIEGEPHRRAVLGCGAFKRITANDPHGPRLTKTRWWLDEDGLLRAYSLHEDRPMSHGVLVAAAILGAEAGDDIEVPANPYDLRGVARV